LKELGLLVTMIVDFIDGVSYENLFTEFSDTKVS